MIGSLLIANRGEIACRIIRTARRLDIRTVAVYSDADAQALHVREADEAVHIGASPARESYLVGEKIIAAARQTGAEAIHPGYGFLSENAEFARGVIDAGIVWVGPHPASITAMGLKDAAKKLMADAGVPVTPGYMGAQQSASFLAEEAAKIGYPVLVKAVAGGGGKGMRLVESEDDFADALASCKREAASSFGNDRVLIEKYIASPRHIEVQVFGDTQGNLVHLFERDCSLQRRHQKVIEEAPAPGMDSATRAALCGAAIRAAKAVDYVGAGTIEFIADGSGPLSADRIWFMEMNTRLQVEHPVTEAITGVDLVEWQLRVASGEPLPLAQHDLAIDGWAMEARLYAEDPARGFLPSIGKLELLHFGDAEYARVDTGVHEGAEVSSHYDPMIAKIIAWGEDREEARERLGEMLSDSAVWPVKTNAAFLVKALRHPDFVSGKIDTGLIGRDGEALAAPPVPSDEALQAAASSLLPVTAMAGFRLNAAPARAALFLLDGEQVEIGLTGQASEKPTSGVLVTEQGQAWLLSPWRRDSAPGGAKGSGAILAPMPGKVIAVDVAQGDVVTKGQKLLTIEAMKMEHTLIAPFDGVVAGLDIAAGAQVQVDALLARIEEKDT
ncbi:3-methylcrotonyl-CoA carboxylase alpha subunit [Novosphingobium sp. CF614]|uniref:acetyl/propionyl/methylcrotonyl-CoA carboxylase subunit alpha n=1 Tax=Novosphingobium sp. CF614 TaxID=1884364 RepID=UPI0008E1D1CB|nr:acetyl/propionyl/methylcrotonyl-CoA carboxylase subunit alpha [Novosphingobium sp. CF614]SFF78659.1 3-methylcrotonyl-CoA carboxylase alpha subunit [Novosphingobium sp. CF614]